jgi:thioredoxin-like negative regulator of GroEL
MSALREHFARLLIEHRFYSSAMRQYKILIGQYLNAGHTSTAVALFKHLADANPTDLKLRYKHAEFLARLGMAEEALAECLGIADEFARYGLYDEAEDFLKRFKWIDHSNKLVLAKREEIARLKAG